MLPTNGLIKPGWPAPDNIGAWFTSRKGGVSTQPWDGFNLATHVDDDLEVVLKNRAILVQQGQLPNEPEWLNQTHSTTIAMLETSSERDADASITQAPKQIAVVLTADCLPLLICNKNGSEVAAIHAGWKGLLDGLVRKTINAMASKPKDCLVWLGPAISQKHFEVGAEIKQQFCQTYAQAEQHFKPDANDKYDVDLYGLAKDQLKQLGVKNIFGGDFCSYEQKDLFYSYRRDGVTGRMASLIWIKE